ncbi:MAG TPA: acetamidase/formamidase family protein [Allosphingosinicella sp.]|nr:acetamidase/formamidase family protein [Allosphingosinicella sp.]
MNRLVAGLAPLMMATAVGARAEAQDSWAGQWDVTAQFANGSASAALTLRRAGNAIEGSSGPLDEAQFFPLDVTGRPSASGAELVLSYRGDPVGRLRVRLRGRALAGTGTLYGMPVTIRGERSGAARRPPVTHDFVPTLYHLQYSGRTAPALRIAPGDRVRTLTLDNEGRDSARQWRGMPGNPLTGPFHVEGAMPGDTLVVHLERVALNRDTAHMYGGTLDEKAVQGGYRQEAMPGWGRTWILDRTKGTARLEKPGKRLGALELPLRPMVGSIGVAPPLNQALFAGDVGFHGGNMDYRRHVAGSTIYLPVWRAGALLSLGDGHALQGDGEISGQGLETSLEVEFRVELIKGKSLGQVWSEDSDHVMVSGIDNSLDSALQMATTGMARWLKARYGLNDSEVATLLGSAIEYDIAEIVDPRPHVVARIAKKVLATIAPP